jgi:hypothetical protein
MDFGPEKGLFLHVKDSSIFVVNKKVTKLLLFLKGKKRVTCNPLPYFQNATVQLQLLVTDK